MSITAETDSAPVAAPLQSENRLQTGYSLSQLAEFIERTSRAWRETDQVQVQLLRALCRLVQTSPAAAMDGYTAYDLVIETRNERPAWPLPADKNDASRRIAKPWESLGVLLATKAEYLAEQMRAAGFGETVGIDKEQGGGQGLPSRYRLRPMPLDVAPASVNELPMIQQPLLGAHEIAYSPEDSALYTGLSAKLVAGIVMTGWARRLFLASAVTTLIGSLAMGVFVLLVAFADKPSRDKIAVSLLVLLIAALIYVFVLPPIRVVTDRILKAPFWLQGWDDNWLLEWRCPPLHNQKSMHRVRYTGSCPLCAGRVEVGARSWMLPADQLIGRCENAPAAHRYSFDHVTRRGHRL